MKDKLEKRKAKVVLDKEKVNRLVKYKYGTIEAYLKKFHLTRMRFWQILNRPHLTKDVKCLKDLADNLNINIDEVLL